MHAHDPRGLLKDPIYFDDDLMWMERKHRRKCMPITQEVHEAINEAFYQDVHAVVHGKIVPQHPGASQTTQSKKL